VLGISAAVTEHRHHPVEIGHERDVLAVVVVGEPADHQVALDVVQRDGHGDGREGHGDERRSAAGAAQAVVHAVGHTDAEGGDEVRGHRGGAEHHQEPDDAAEHAGAEPEQHTPLQRLHAGDPFDVTHGVPL
jgi:hypothetical protein